MIMTADVPTFLIASYAQHVRSNAVSNEVPRENDK